MSYDYPNLSFESEAMPLTIQWLNDNGYSIRDLRSTEADFNHKGDLLNERDGSYLQIKNRRESYYHMHKRDNLILVPTTDPRVSNGGQSIYNDDSNEYIYVYFENNKVVKVIILFTQKLKEVISSCKGEIKTSGNGSMTQFKLVNMNDIPKYVIKRIWTLSSNSLDCFV